MSQRALIGTLLAGAILFAAPAAVSQDKVTASTFTTAQLTERAMRRRAVEAVNWGMPAVNYDLMLQAMIKARGAPEPDRLLVEAARLEEPDAHAQPRHDLSSAVLEHEGRRADRDRDSAGG